MPILEITGLRKTYTTRLGGNRVEALKNVSFTAEPGEYIAIMGESGSGKTTLLNILAALDKPTGGSVILDGMDLAKIKESKLADFRRDNLGFVFQEFNLLDTFTVRDNILLPLVLRGEKYPAMQPKLNSTAELLGVEEWVLTIIAGLLMTATAATGMKGLEIVAYISVPLIVILGVYSMITAGVEGGGLAAIFGQSAGKISLFTGVGYVIGSFISGGTATPNFIRFAKNRKVAVWTTVIAFFLGNTLMFCFGAIGGAFTGKEDIFYVMIAQGLAIPALIVLGANIWTTNNNALYTGGLGLANITGKPMKHLTWVAGIIGTALAIWLYYNFVGWLNVLNCALPPIGMIVILDYFKNRSKYEGKHTEAVVNWFNVLGIIAAAAVANFLHWGIAAVNAMVVSAIFFFIGELTGANK